MEKGLTPSSPKEHIKNMWLDFKLHPRQRHPSSSSLRSLPGGRGGGGGGRKGKPTSEGRSRQEEEAAWRHRGVTVPRPFHLSQRQRGAGKTRSDVELENAALRRQLDELGECQKKFRAGPVPAHVRLPLYEELQEQRQAKREQREEEQNRRIAPKPFSFLERERHRKEQQEQQRLLLLQTSSSQQEQQEVKPFRARPVPRAVYTAAAGERAQEEQLYRSIKMQMRAAEMLQGSAMPPSMLARSMLARSLAGRSNTLEGDSSSHKPKINADVPDFDAKHRRFQKHMESRKEVRPVTSCVPFTLSTSPRRRAEEEQSIPPAGPSRWPYVTARTLRTPPSSSSLCSSLSGSLELLPAKVTDASRKRQEAVR